MIVREIPSPEGRDHNKADNQDEHVKMHSRVLSAERLGPTLTRLPRDGSEPPGAARGESGADGRQGEEAGSGVSAGSVKLGSAIGCR